MFPTFTCHRPPSWVNVLYCSILMADTMYDITSVPYISSTQHPWMKAVIASCFSPLFHFLLVENLAFLFTAAQR